MSILKRTINFDQFCYIAFQTLYETYESNKEKFLELAQWENEIKLTKKDSEELWRQFWYLIPTAISYYALDYFKYQHPMEEISKRVTEAQIYFLWNNLGMTKKNVGKSIDMQVRWMEELEPRFEERIAQLEKDGPIAYSWKKLLTELSIAFVKMYQEDDRSWDEISSQVETYNSAKMFAGLKMSKPLAMKNGIIDKLFHDFRIKW